MCARVTLRSGYKDVAEEFGVTGAEPFEIERRYNIPPSSLVTAVVGNGSNSLRRFRWGLVPRWAKDPSIGHKLINARAESIAEKPSFKDAFIHRRCLIVVDGFYEWKKEKGRSTPYFVHRPGDGLFALAGLYEHWRAPGGEELDTCTVVTTEANEAVRPIHGRMPVIVPQEDRRTWLDPGAAPDDLKKILRPLAGGELEAYEVSRMVNAPSHDEPGCVRPLPK